MVLGRARLSRTSHLLLLWGGRGCGRRRGRGRSRIYTKRTHHHILLKVFFLFFLVFLCLLESCLGPHHPGFSLGGRSELAERSTTLELVLCKPVISGARSTVDSTHHDSKVRWFLGTLAITSPAMSAVQVDFIME